MCIAVVVTCFQITEIGRQIVGQTIYTGLLVQNGHDLVDVLALFVSDELHDGRIDITGTGSHDHTFERGKAHGGIYTFAVLYSGKGSTISHMAYDDLQIFVLFAQNLRSLPGYIRVAGSVEAVLAHAVFLVIGVGQGVHVIHRRDRLVERGVEHRDLLHARQDLFDRKHAFEIGGVVQRGDLAQRADLRLDVLGDDAALGEELAAVGYAVAAVSWPEQVFRYPQPYTAIPLWDASGVPVSSAIEDTLSSGGMLNYSSIALSLGEYAAPMGTGAALVLLACGLFLWSQKDAHMTASVSFLATCALIAFFFPRQAGLAESDVLVNALPRLQCVRDELLTGAVLFSAVFLINEPYTCAHHRMGRILYGVLVGGVSMGFRYYGVYETGVCFAVLAVNSISAWIDRTEVRLYRLLHHLPASGAGKEAAE